MKEQRGICFTILAVLAVACLAASGISAATAKHSALGRAEMRKVTEKPQKLTLNSQAVSPQFKALESKSWDYSMKAEALQGGEDIASAVAITSMPFSATGTTVGYINNYDEACPLASTSPDVVYSYTPSSDELVDISLCLSSYATHLWVYETDAAHVVACNRFDVSCSPNLRSALTKVRMSAGKTYYIVIDGDNGQSGAYQINCSAQPAPPVLSLHPALSDGGSGNLAMGFEYYSTDTQLYWQGSGDDGATWTGAVYFSFDSIPKYPSLDYWGPTSRFFGTFVTPKSVTDSGSSTYLIRIDNPADPNTFGASYWAWADYGWHDMKMAAIACDNGLADWQWGVISMVHSTHYGGGNIINGPFISYPTSSTGQATLSWYNGADGCNTTAIDIDRVNHKSWAAYDLYDTDSSQWVIFLRQDFTDNWVLDGNAWVFSIGNSREHSQYPAVAANNGKLIMLTEYWNENTGTDRDIVVWRASDSGLATMTHAVLAGTSASERYPKIRHVEADTYVATFVRNDSLFAVTTEDAGANWSAPEFANADNQKVVSEYRTSDIADAGSKYIWEYQVPTGGKQLAGESIYLMWAKSFLFDRDRDGFKNAVDNCPTVYNPDQKDANLDGIGDACCCIGTRGNANGDPLDKVNVADVTFLLAYFFGIPSGPAPGCPTEANVNGDLLEKVNVTDVTFALAYLFGIPAGPPPGACPFVPPL